MKTIIIKFVIAIVIAFNFNVTAQEKRYIKEKFLQL